MSYFGFKKKYNQKCKNIYSKQFYNFKRNQDPITRYNRLKK